MDNNNWRPIQGGEPAMDAVDWRTQLQPDSRQRIVNKIMDTLKKHLPFSGNDGLQELKKIAERFEEKIYSAATSQSDYLRKISLKMLAMETKSQTTIPNSMPTNSGGNNNRPPDPGNMGMQSQVHNPGQPLAMPLPGNQPQNRQQLMPQNIQNANGVQNAPSLPSAMPPASNLSQPSMPAGVGQNMQANPQNPVGNPMGQNVANLYANSQRQMPARQQQIVNQQQQQQPPQNQQQYLYQQQQLQQQLLNKPKFNQGNMPQSMMQPHMQQQQQQQQQQQNLLQQNQMQTSQQGVIQTSSAMQPSMMQSQASSVQQSSKPMVQQHPQSALRQQQQTQQTQVPHQQQPQVPHQQQPNSTNMQGTHLMGHQNNVGEMQQQRMLMAQQNNMSNMHQQQQSNNNLPNLQQQQQMLVGNQPGNASMQSNQHGVHLMQQPKAQMQASQAQQSQQMMSQMQAQPQQMQQQLGMQQQQQRLQAPGQNGGSLLQPQNVMDQQKQMYQAQRIPPDTSSSMASMDSTAQTGHANGGDWQEEVYQKIKVMKDLYLPELSDMYQKIATKLQQHDSLPQQPKTEQFEKLKMFKAMLERAITFLQVSKANIQPGFKDKLPNYEKQIINFINTNKPRKIPQMQPGQLQPSQMSQAQSQMSQAQAHEAQMNMMNPQSSVATAQQQNPMPQQNMMLQPNSNMDSGLQVSMGSLQQNNSVNAPAPQQANNINAMSSQNTLQPNPGMLQHPHIKQEQQMLLKQQQYQQRQMQHQILQKQQLLQQQQQQAKQHNTLQQPHQMNDGPDIKMRPVMNMKSSVLQNQNQNLPVGPRSVYPVNQQMKSNSPFSNQQLLQVSSPQLLQHPSPQVDQQGLLTSKIGTPLQSASSPYIAPSPSTPMAPSPMPGDSEKPVPGASSLSNAGQQTNSVVVATPAQSLAIGTPGISASPLLAEFSGPDGAGNVLAVVSGKSSEQPIDRLMKVVKSMSMKSLSAAVSDIGSVVSMIDRIAGSAPGNGSRAAVGEDLVAMTKCRLQVRNFMTHDGTNGTRKMKRYTSAMPLNVVSSTSSVNDSLKGPDTPELESTATSSSKRPRLVANHALSEEIREINLRLIDTVVDISDEDIDPSTADGGEGTIVKCSYTAVALSSYLKAQYSSGQMAPIQPLRLLVPTNYPSCSPVLLDKFPVEVSKEYEDLSAKTKSRFSISLRSLSQPMSLGEIARTWDFCARAAITEYAQQSGGGTFSSKYGAWENCLSAA